MPMLACENDYVRVLIVGSDPELTSEPVEIQASVYGDFQKVSIGYTDTLRASDGSASDLPYTDFAVQFDTATPQVTVRAVVDAANRWGGDASVSLPGNGAEVKIALFAAEQNADTGSDVSIGSDVFDNAAALDKGLVLAWASSKGVQATVLPDPDNPAAPSTGPEAIASGSARNVRLSSCQSDWDTSAYAVAWKDTDGELWVRTATQADTRPAIQVDNGRDIRAACTVKNESVYVVVAYLKDDRLELAWAEPDGTVGASTTIEASGVDAIVGLRMLDDERVVVAYRSGSKSKIVRGSKDDGFDTTVTLDEQALALSLTEDEHRILVATTSDSVLTIRSYFASGLADAGTETIGKYTFSADGLRAGVSLDSCVVAWPEMRDDGSGLVDLRFQYLDDDGAPSGESHLVNVHPQGYHFAPSAVCLSSSRAYAAFVSQPSAADTTGTLKFRRLPPLGDLLTP